MHSLRGKWWIIIRMARDTEKKQGRNVFASLFGIYTYFFQLFLLTSFFYQLVSSRWSISFSLCAHWRKFAETMNVYQRWMKIHVKIHAKRPKKLLGQISGSGFDKWTPEGKNSNTNYRTVTIAWQNDDKNPRQWWKQPTDTEHLCSDDRIIECRRFINR